MDDPTLLRSLELLRRAREGDARAMDALFRRYLPRLRRWASGRLPGRARALMDTDDVIQETMLRTCGKLERFEPRGEGALLAYLIQALRHRIVDEVRKADRRPRGEELDDESPSPDPSPLEATIGKESVALYERALEALSEQERELVIARVELGMEYAEIAEASGKPSPDAARMGVSRALLKLAEEMGRGGN